MYIFKRNKDLTLYLDQKKKEGKIIGYVPTMGALHEGHMSLINKSQSMSDITCCGIFVNPTQFNDPSDLEKYPVTIEADIKLLMEHKCDVLYLPTFEEVYPEGADWENPYDFGPMFNMMEGATRPGHFNGVVQVVKRLLDLVQPHKLIMGQKDYQQFSIINKLLELESSSIELVMGETIREDSGLAMSSRNRRLLSSDRSYALMLFKTLDYIKENISTMDICELKKLAQKMLTGERFQLEYVDIVDGGTLLPISEFEGHESVVACIACYVGKVRLIDNFVLK